MTRHYGLLGKSLTHSFSAEYFQEKWTQLGISGLQYTLFEIPSIEALPELIEQELDLFGLNVTIPYKAEVIPYLDFISPDAEAVGAVNTLVVERGERIRLHGHNTDIAGFSGEIRPLLKPWMDRALILGDGASSRTVRYVLQQIGLDTLRVSRKGGDDTILWSEVNEYVIQHHPLIINTTPIGQFPAVGDCPPLPYSALSARHLLFDLVYNPDPSRFLQEGILHGAKTQSGMGMLRLQADKSWDLWSAEIPSDDARCFGSRES